MKLSTGLVAVLVCIALVAPALGTGVVMFNGADGKSTSGTVSGGAVNKYTYTTNTASLTEGVEAHAALASGVAGNAWARFGQTPLTFARTVTKSLNGETYSLNAGYTGVTVNAGVRRTGSNKAGAVSADAVVEAQASVDNTIVDSVHTDLLKGWAMIDSKTSNAGTAESYALAQGAANFDVKKICPTCNSPKEVIGGVRGMTDIESIKTECMGCPCNVPAPSGTVSGEAKIWAEGNANDYASYVKTNTNIALTSKRGTNYGTSLINAMARADDAHAWAYDGTTPVNIMKLANGDDANVKATEIANLDSIANTYTPGDVATTNINVLAEATHNTASNGDYDKAYGQMYTKSQVTRANVPSFVEPAAFAQSRIEDIGEIPEGTGIGTKFLARAQDYGGQPMAQVQTSQGELLGIDDITTAANINNADTGYAAINLQLTGIQDNGNVFAKINNVVDVKGVSGSGSAADFVDAYFEDILGLRAEATATPSNFVTVSTDFFGDVDARINGATGLALTGDFNPNPVFTGKQQGDDKTQTRSNTVTGAPGDFAFKDNYLAQLKTKTYVP